MISFIVPAHNEELWIGACVGSINDAAAAADIEHEVVVAADACTDRTAEIATSMGARVVEVDHRQISKVRNSGAREATFDRFIFVDGDTSITPEVLRAVLAQFEQGVVGGGAGADMDGPAPRWAKVVLEMTVWSFRVFNIAAGCFVYCTREAFEAVGGFDETIYASEETVFSSAMKRKAGKFVVVKERVVTSGRKLRTFSGREIFGVIFREIWVRPSRRFTEPERLDIWYGARRDDPHDRARTEVPSAS